MKYFALILVFLFILLFSCQKIDNDDTNQFSPKTTDTLTFVYQEFRADSLILKFDTQSVYIENNDERLMIIGKWDTTIVSKLTSPQSVELLSRFDDRVCSNPQFVCRLYKFGQIYRNGCWTEKNGIPWSDSGVGKIVSSLYGVILYRGYFTNSGQVISSIDGDIVPKNIKEVLIDLE